MNIIETMKKALDVWENHQGNYKLTKAEAKIQQDAQDSLRAAIDAAEKQEPVRQYYYKVSGCSAESAHDPSCVCWHDEGSGPLRKMLDDTYIVDLEWRNHPAPTQSDSEQAKDAERYRWLRDGGIYNLPYDNHGYGPEFDLSESAIDAAMKVGAGGTGEGS